MKIITKNIILSENADIAPDGFFGYTIQNLSDALVTINNSIVLKLYERWDNYQLPAESVFGNHLLINCNNQLKMKVAVVLYYKK